MNAPEPLPKRVIILGRPIHGIIFELPGFHGKFRNQAIQGTWRVVKEDEEWEVSWMDSVSVIWKLFLQFQSINFPRVRRTHFYDFAQRRAQWPAAWVAASISFNGIQEEYNKGS